MLSVVVLSFSLKKMNSHFHGMVDSSSMLRYVCGCSEGKAEDEEYDDDEEKEEDDDNNDESCCCCKEVSINEGSFHSAMSVKSYVIVFSNSFTEVMIASTAR